ncbi:MAG: Holliday junction ATP-dependent DNA helicase RuvA [Thermodesulfobacteriota bacterium]|nr:MAG: Holliday junction ATP-dependent DNA helicase RuvA [Thermodesulfobacteriota bacterium]
MISLLRGNIAQKSLGKVVVDVNGVGYGVTVPLSTYYRLPETGKEATLEIHTHMKDSGIELFGFLTQDEKDIFTILIGVSGVGPKVATNILSNISPSEFATAITSGDLAKRKIAGIGPKMASRLTTELKDKVQTFQPSSELPTKSGIVGDVISALMNLGYKRPEIDERISELEHITSNEENLEVALRESLKVMKKG